MVDIQAIGNASLSLFCLMGGVGIVVMLARDKTIKRLRKQNKELNDRLEEITMKRFDEAFEYSDLVFSVSKQTEEALSEKNRKIDELQTEVNNLRHRNKQLERGIK